MCMTGKGGFLDGFVCLAVLLAVLLRWCTSLYPYSGQSKPPMFGDYEAQRHWMEITSNLPLKDWYIYTTNNDLMYWGLDYPPLTAYHSLLCGYASQYVNPDFVRLNASRGYESYEHKLFMRTTVIIVDLLIYIPAVLWFYSCHSTKTYKASFVSGKEPGISDKHTSVIVNNNVNNELKSSIFIALIYPGLILIDYGHFQYNNMSLGLFVAALAALTHKNDLIGSGLFCLAVSYKQMELYHALPFFCYLLGSCIPKPNAQPFYDGLKRLVKIALTVVVTFAVVWFPFCKDMRILLQVMYRLFPLARGVFEDKVANIWCSLNVVYKLRNMFTNESMARICLISTAIAILPTSIDLLLKPTVKKLHIALINSSLAFFLFSFQVHEKSILLAAVPVALYFHNDPLVCFWFLFVSIFSMLPLLLKDGLLIPTIALTIFFSLSVYLAMNFSFQPLKNVHDSHNNPKQVKKSYMLSQNVTDKGLQRLVEHVEVPPRYTFVENIFVEIAFYISLLVCLLLTVCTVVLTPPLRYPDIFPLLISVFSCLHFLTFFLYFHYVQIFSL